MAGGTRLRPLTLAALVVVMGSASLITHDPRFVMVKPSIGAFAIACVMLRRGCKNSLLCDANVLPLMVSV